MFTIRKFCIKAALVLTVVLGLIILTGSVLSALRAPQSAPEFTHAGPTLEAVRSLAALVTTQVTLADATTCEIKGIGGSMSAVLVIRGDALIVIDLQQARLSRMDARNNTFELELPQPRVTQARVDHQRTRVFALERHGFWKLMRLDDVTRQLVDSGLREAQQTIEKAAGDEAIMAGARDHARQVLSAFAQSSGWKLLVIRWNVPSDSIVKK